MECKGFDLGQDAGNDGGVENFQFAASRTGKSNGIFTWLGGEDDLHGIQRFSWFTDSIPGNDTIVKVFPELSHGASDQMRYCPVFCPRLFVTKSDLLSCFLQFASCLWLKSNLNLLKTQDSTVVDRTSDVVTRCIGVTSADEIPRVLASRGK